MQIFLVLGLVIAILAVVFAVQNVAVVAISFFTWKVDLSLAVALLLALAAGVLVWPASMSECICLGMGSAL